MGLSAAKGRSLEKLGRKCDTGHMTVAGAGIKNDRFRRPFCGDKADVSVNGNERRHRLPLILGIAMHTSDDYHDQIIGAHISNRAVVNGDRPAELKISAGIWMGGWRNSKHYGFGQPTTIMQQQTTEITQAQERERQVGSSKG